MRRRVCYIFWAAIIACQSATAADTPQENKHTEFSITIELPSEIVIEERQIKLGSVALIKTGDMELLKTLMILPLGRISTYGNLVELKRNTLSRWIKSQTRIDTNKIHWRGATTTKITIATRKVEGKQLAEVGRLALIKWLEMCSDQSSLKLVGNVPDLDLPKGEIDFKARPITDIRPRKKMIVWVEAYVDRHLMKARPVTFEVEAFHFVPTALKDLPAGASLDQKTIEFQKRDITQLTSIAWDGDRLTATRMRRPVQSGRVLLMGDIEPIPTVTRGEWVTLQLKLGAVAVEDRVEVLQDGFTGQTIRVKQTTASQSILARVVGPGLVGVQQ